MALQSIRDAAHEHPHLRNGAVWIALAAALTLPVGGSVVDFATLAAFGLGPSVVGFLAGRSADAFGVSIRTRDVVSGLVVVVLGLSVVALGVETSVLLLDAFGVLFALLGAYTLFRASRGAPLSAA